MHFPFETRTSHESSTAPLALRTPLGWIIKGPSNTKRSSVPYATMLLNGWHIPSAAEPLENLIVIEEGDIFPSKTSDYCEDVDALMQWLQTNKEIKEFGIKYSREDIVAYDCMMKNVKLIDGHYQLPLLWKNASAQLPESMTMAAKRLDGVKRRLQRDSVLKNMYCLQMQTVLDQGYAEKVPVSEINTANKLWYIPHHPVTNEHKPGKV